MDAKFVFNENGLAIFSGIYNICFGKYLWLGALNQIHTESSDLTVMFITGYVFTRGGYVDLSRKISLPLGSTLHQYDWIWAKTVQTWKIFTRYISDAFN